MHPDQYHRVALSRVPTIGAKLFRSLLTHFETAEAALTARPRELREVPGIGERTAAHFADDRHRREADSILHFAERNGIDVLCCLDATYPARLATFPGAPPILYYRGQADLSNPRSVAVVGTRNMSPHGSRQIERLLAPLAEFAPLIVSGLAYGVDIRAHRCAMNAGLPTVGVMGSGFQRVYPGAHLKTALRMISKGGGILTEYPYWVKPEREHFPARNRIVAMLSDLTIVVESNASGGSMITAGMAHDLGRKLGACPGRPGDDTAAGCNALIREGRAHLIESGQDVIDLLKWTGPGPGRQRRLFDDLDPAETALVDRLRDRTAVDLDELRFELGVPPAKLANTLLMLEVKGVVASLPGGRYRLTG